MRQIDVTTPVFSAIWARREEGEENENDILERLLNVRTTLIKNDKISIGALIKVNWRDDVKSALQNIGRPAHLSHIYTEVRRIRKTNGRSTPKSTEAIIRRELENNSSDSNVFLEKHDWFTAIEGIGNGIWGLRG